MAPAPGAHLGAYQIVSLIGQGGMGEVFRARDLRLGRDVAIKTLPADVAANPDRRARFEREAHLLAALNHPNVAHIYGIEESSGELALVMELVDGPTVADLIARGPVSKDVALAIAKQIADALEFAHEHGIVHRDLKPANIKVRPDGAVKVLDFGLAKALDPAGSDVNSPTMSPTIPVHATKAGIILGTAAYMAPEQATGEPVDRRADVWAFGVVLYEMLTGAALFARSTSTESLAGVLAAPIDFARLPPETPPVVRDLIRRCLQRDRKRRLQHIGDARIAVEEALAPQESSALPVPDNTSRRRRSWSIAGAVALTAVAGIVGWALGRGPSVASPADVIRLSIPDLDVQTRGPFGARHVAISNDGSTIAYGSTRGVWIRKIGQREPAKIAARDQNPFFSPDGNWLGLFGLAGISKLPVGGGTPVPIASTSERPGGATWSRNGTIVFATSDGLYQVPDSGGEVRTLAKPDRARKHRGYLWPQFMPDGQSVLFTILADGPSEAAQIALLDLQTLAIRIVLSGGSAPRYTPSGRIVYAAGRALKTVGFDPSSGQTRGESVTLPDISIATAPDNGAAEFAVSDTGTLVFLPPESGPSRTLLWVDRHGNEAPLPLPAGNYVYPRVSPDGARVALDIPDANRDIWIVDLQRMTLTRLTDGPTEDMTPIWSPDGGRVYFASNRTGTFGVYSQAADGASPARLEFIGPTSSSPTGVSPDGTRVFVVSNFRDLVLLDLTKPTRALQRMMPPGPIYWAGVMSPDGAWIAYESNESGGQTEVFVRPFPEVATRREKISIDGGRFPLWGPKGSGELFYVDGSGAMMAASVTLSPSLRVGGATKLFDFLPPPAGISGRPYDVSPVDGRFLVSRIISPAARTVDLSVVMHWESLLR